MDTGVGGGKGDAARLKVGLTADCDAERGDDTNSCVSQRKLEKMRGGRGKRAAAGIVVGLTDQTLSCTAKAHVPKPVRHAARCM
jgi:hypothetical protein